MNSPTPACGAVAWAASEPYAGDDWPLVLASAATADRPPLVLASAAPADPPDGEIGPAVQPNDARPGAVGGAGP